jgi:pyruvate dehydrogenase E1 component beta subunit
MEQGFDDLDAPVKRVAGIEIPDPYNKHLEYQAFPHKADIIKAVREVLK